MSRLKIPKIGVKYGRVTIIRLFPPKYGRKTYALGVCECGNKIKILATRLTCGNTKSCGCLIIESIRERSITHGLSGHPLYKVWCGIRARCNCSPTHPCYHLYPARGIKMCKKWEKDFLSFYHWALSHGWKKGLHLDRRNNNRGYMPSNCRFVTSIINHRNMTTNVFITWRGETKCVSEWAIVTGIGRQTIAYRIKQGVPPHIALTQKGRINIKPKK